MPLHQRRNVAVLSTGEQIAFPVAGNGSATRLQYFLYGVLLRKDERICSISLA
jgi:hypothetical protein